VIYQHQSSMVLRESLGTRLVSNWTISPAYYSLLGSPGECVGAVNTR